mmetsp:Transcript_44578/g.140699  ORF Transcript_44578/g.140699 Transcript_44578/m.140699 type:complete len:83 (+) Transcript_44578:429-677(+)
MFPSQLGWAVTRFSARSRRCDVLTRHGSFLSYKSDDDKFYLDFFLAAPSSLWLLLPPLEALISFLSTLSGSKNSSRTPVRRG